MSEATTSLGQSNWRIETWFPELPKEVGAQLKKLYQELSVANKTQNLITPKTVPFADAIHFADSIIAMNLIVSDAPSVDEIYDLGSGAGFPGLVGAIMFPNVKFILVEIDSNKSEYIKQSATKLGLNNVEVVTSNIEALPAGSVRFAVTRGIANISKLILMTRRCIAKGGVLYHMKSENWSMEVGEIPTQLCSVWSPALVKEYRLPIGEVRFAIVKTDKIS